MKITGLKTFVLGSGWRNLILLRLDTDVPGLYGIGEATVQWGDEGMLGYLVSLEKRYLIGADPRDIEALWERVYRNEYWRRDFFVCSALGGVEMACWDILGKSLGVPGVAPSRWQMPRDRARICEWMVSGGTHP